MNEIVTVKSGRFAGEEFRVEGKIYDVMGEYDLFVLAKEGNWAARNAIQIDNYTMDDEPLYYGKIGSLGYIISGKDLGI